MMHGRSVLKIMKIKPAKRHLLYMKCSWGYILVPIFMVTQYGFRLKFKVADDLSSRGLYRLCFIGWMQKGSIKCYPKEHRIKG